MLNPSQFWSYSHPSIVQATLQCFFFFLKVYHTSGSWLTSKASGTGCGTCQHPSHRCLDHSMFQARLLRCALPDLQLLCESRSRLQSSYDSHPYLPGAAPWPQAVWSCHYPVLPWHAPQDGWSPYWLVFAPQASHSVCQPCSASGTHSGLHCCWSFCSCCCCCTCCRRIWDWCCALLGCGLCHC